MSTRTPSTRELYLALCEVIEPAPTARPERPAPVDPAPVLAVAARAFGLTAADLIGRARGDQVVAARQAAMVVLRRRGLSLPAVGRALGRDHTTVMHGLAAADDRARRDPAYAARLAALSPDQ